MTDRRYVLAEDQHGRWLCAVEGLGGEGGWSPVEIFPANGVGFALKATIATRQKQAERRAVEDGDVVGAAGERR